MDENMLQYEESIDIKDLCIYILRKWKAIIVAVLLGAVAFGGYKATTDTYEITDAAQEKANQEIIDEKRKIQTQNINDITVLGKEIQPNRDRLEAIRSMEKEISTKQNELECLVRIVDGYQLLIEELNALLVNETNPEICVELINKIASYEMSKIGNENQVSAAEHRIDLLKKEIALFEEELTATDEEVTELEQLKNSLQQQNIALEKEILAIQKGEIDKITVKVSIKDIIKFAVLGAVAGGVVICGIAFLQYITYPKLRRKEDMKERYGLRVLGSYFVTTQKKNPIDRLLDRWEGVSYRIDTEKESALVAAKIQVLTPVEQNGQNIIVTGTVSKDTLDRMCAYLQKYIPGDQYKISVLPNPVYDADAMLKIKNAIVVIVEACSVSDKKEIAELMDILHAGQANVLGVVLQ